MKLKNQCLMGKIRSGLMFKKKLKEEAIEEGGSGLRDDDYYDI